MAEVAHHHQEILFFSRGKGRGHAVPDAAIAQELVEREPDIAITFVSYSVGAATLRNLGWNVIDLELPEDNPLWETVVRMAPLLEKRRPALVVSHEEFAAVPLAKAFGVPAIFLTDWFLNADHPYMQALAYASEIIFMDNPGYYAEPGYLKGRICYTGTVFRRMGLETADGQRRRKEFGIPDDAITITVVPGGAEFHSEKRAPMFDLVLAAFEGLPHAPKRLLWVVGGHDHDVLQSKSQNRTDVLIRPPHDDFTSTLLASDVVITKGNRTPIFECEALGLSSLSISYGINPIDEYRVIRVPSNIAVLAQGVTHTVLKDYLLRALTTQAQATAKTDLAAGRLRATDRIQYFMRAARLSATA